MRTGYHATPSATRCRTGAWDVSVRNRSAWVSRSRCRAAASTWRARSASEFVIKATNIRVRTRMWRCTGHPSSSTPMRNSRGYLCMTNHSRSLRMLLRFRLIALLMAVAASPLGAQSVAPWRFGLAGGVSLNTSGVGYALWGPDGSTNPDRANGQFIADVGIDGSGIAPYAGLLAEYISPSWWGLHARLAFDDRSLTAIDDRSYQVGDRYLADEFAFTARYITIDPRLRIAPVPQSPLAFTLGLGASMALQSSVAYLADGTAAPVTYDIPSANRVALSVNGGLTYDVPISVTSATRFTLTPFVDVSWMMAMRGVDQRAQNATTNALQSISARIGIAITRGAVNEALAPDPDEDEFYIKVRPSASAGSQVQSVEHMPMLPSVFFATSDKRLPPRYRLRKLRAYDSASSYYDVISVAAGLLNAVPNVTLTLVGYDPEGGNGLAMAQIVKTRILDLAFVDSARIVIRGERMPPAATPTTGLMGSEQAAAMEENRRVDILCSDPQKWPSIINVTQRAATIESNMVVDVVSSDVLQPWSVNISADDLPNTRTFGPFDGRRAVIAEAEVPRGSSNRIKVAVKAQTVEGKQLSDSKTVSLGTDPAANLASERHVLTMTMGEADPTTRWKSYVEANLSKHLRNGCRVIVHGHTDDIGLADVNRKLSYQQAERVAMMIQRIIDSRGLQNVELLTVGHGEDAADGVMRPETPEGRMYNRAVIIDVVYPEQ
ncbi:MAG: hypothetical protein FGM24_11330 [Candidatus Kapabacteria bacterium]|nr:hypothetical protein [Candidatus Kapabacteria bacterium]